MTTIHAAAPHGIVSDASRLASTLRRTVVEIRSPAGGGAGVIWGGGGLVVTNAHCVRRGGGPAVGGNWEEELGGAGGFWGGTERAVLCARFGVGHLLLRRRLYP